MPTTEYDLRYLRAGIQELESYLLSGEIYQPLGISAPIGEKPYPQLTLGWLLLARLRARATAQSSAQKAELERLSQELEATRTRWRAAWEKKARAEFRARLNLWRDFLEEYRQDPEANYDRYGYEVGRRVLLQLLSGEIDELPEAEQEALSGLDLVLKAIFVPGEFIWDGELAASFPKTPYWYLYGRIKSQM